MAFARIEGFGDQRADRRAAVMAASQIAAWGGEVDIGRLANYMDPDAGTQEVTPDQAAMMFKGFMGSRGD